MKGEVKVLASDLEIQPNTVAFYLNGVLTWGGLFSSKKLYFKDEVEKLQLQTQESVKTLTGTAGWALAGAVLAGPLGALVGGLLGGRGNRVCFLAFFKNGKKLLATTDTPTFNDMQAAIL